MWFIFPQLQGLGRSATARFYGIVGPEEAEAYWRHPLLRQRLIQCTGLVLGTQGRTARQIFGSPDDMKLQSCMTLFSVVAPREPAFGEVLRRYFGDQRDSMTLASMG